MAVQNPPYPIPPTLEELQDNLAQVKSRTTAATRRAGRWPNEIRLFPGKQDRGRSAHAISLRRLARE